jgi:hypothetical protein
MTGLPRFPPSLRALARALRKRPVFPSGIFIGLGLTM